MLDFPIISQLRGYDGSRFSRDLVAGLSVAAVQVPTAMAYASLAGFPPEVGLYSSIFPVLVFAMLSSSPQLMIGPDAATCALIAAILVPLAGGDLVLYMKLSAILASTVGFLMVIGSYLRMGFIANFFGRPVLVGFLNGIALSIIVSQLGKVLGIPVQSHDFGPAVIEIL